MTFLMIFILKIGFFLKLNNDIIFNENDIRLGNLLWHFDYFGRQFPAVCSNSVLLLRVLHVFQQKPDLYQVQIQCNIKHLFKAQQ